MPLIDDRGRLFGRLNIVDAIVVGFLIVLFPLAYAGYLLFRTPTPRLVSVQPTVLKSAAGQRIVVVGEHFRPYLRITFNAVKAKSFLLEDFTRADVGVPELPPGKYDVTLYDEAKELARLPGAITVVAQAFERNATLRVNGKFRGIAKDAVDTFRAGATFGNPGQDPIAEVLGADPPSPEERWIDAGDTISIPIQDRYQVAATVRVGCAFDGRICKLGESPVAPRQTLPLPRTDGSAATFYIEDVRPDRDPVELEAHVRFVAPAGVASLVRPGDRDTGFVTRPVSIAWLVNTSSPREVTGQSQIETQINMQRYATSIPGPVSTIDAVVRMRAEESPFGWFFKAQQVKVGATFSFETPRYVMRGWITDLKPVAAAVPTNQ